jgi:dUTPase
MSQKKKGTVATLLPPSPATEHNQPVLNKVVTKLEPDSPEFVPEQQPGKHSVSLSANMPNKQPVNLPHRMTLKVDCGFTMTLPAGYRASITATADMAMKGLVVSNPASFVDGRVSVLVANVGKEIIPLQHGQKFAEMFVEPAYYFEWVQ